MVAGSIGEAERDRLTVAGRLPALLPDDATLRSLRGGVGVRHYRTAVISVTARSTPRRCYHRGVSEHDERLEKLSERISAAKEFL